MAELGFIQKEIELRQNLAGENFTEPPRYGAKVCIMGEILTAFDFEEDNLYLFTEIRLPEGWSFNDEDYYDPRATDTDESDLINRKRSITHTVKSTASPDDRKPIAHFSFPFSYCLFADSLLSDWPKVCVQVNSVDSWERHRIMGYGFLEFPPSPGFHELSVQTWRPIESVQTEIYSFYLGGSVRIENPWELCDSSAPDESGNESVVNRYGLHTRSSGSVQFRFSILTQTLEAREASRQEAQKLNLKQKSELARRRREKRSEIIERTAKQLRPL